MNIKDILKWNFGTLLYGGYIGGPIALIVFIVALFSSGAVGMYEVSVFAQEEVLLGMLNNLGIMYAFGLAVRYLRFLVAFDIDDALNKLNK